jgi:glucose-6-phosphate 1-dehydrogenase
MDFREQINHFLKKGTEEEKKEFLDLCIYRQDAYDSAKDVGRVFRELEKMEQELLTGRVNRLFYFAIPPTVFVPIGKSIKEAVINKTNRQDTADINNNVNTHRRTGWSRLIVEKPFGNDSESFEELSNAMSALYTEEYIYRIDHYLGKEMVQNEDSQMQFLNPCGTEITSKACKSRSKRILVPRVGKDTLTATVSSETSFKIIYYRSYL